MPKSRIKRKVDSNIITDVVPRKFRVGTRKSGKSAHLMNNAALLDIVRGPAKKNIKNAISVLKLRGVTV